ncbi:MAG: ketosteroid isomerase-like protein [Saprospiraceae bacterium]|jgi:ketosteroid isomerase-like protein
MDGPLAYAWTEYSFYVDDELLHCGVNMFEMAQIDQHWKITNITDTRRKTDCKKGTKEDINTFMDVWHKSAATADENVFFGSMAEDAIYIGTDISERWTKTQMMKDLMKYFTQSQSAWSFTAKERNIVVAESGEVAWIDEALDTWMGDCRSTAVLVKSDDGWKIQHYQLSMAVPNDKVDGYLQLIGKPRRD